MQSLRASGSGASCHDSLLCEAAGMLCRQGAAGISTQRGGWEYIYRQRYIYIYIGKTCSHCPPLLYRQHAVTACLYCLHSGRRQVFTPAASPSKYSCRPLRVQQDAVTVRLSTASPAPPPPCSCRPLRIQQDAVNVRLYCLSCLLAPAASPVVRGDTYTYTYRFTYRYTYTHVSVHMYIRTHI